MAQVSIKAFPRSEFGKGAARRSRREGLVPAVIYGQGQEPVHVGLPVHELTLALRYPGLVLELDLDGTKSLVSPRDVQRDPVRRILEHLDLVLVTKAEAAALVAAGIAAEAAAEAAHEAEAVALSHSAAGSAEDDVTEHAEHAAHAETADTDAGDDA